MSDRHIEEQWQKYRAMVIPAGASPEQINETRRAFYAGAGALWEALLGGVSESEGYVEQDERLMRNIQRELNTFLAAELRQVAHGKQN